MIKAQKKKTENWKYKILYNSIIVNDINNNVNNTKITVF